MSARFLGTQVIYCYVHLPREYALQPGSWQTIHPYGQALEGSLSVCQLALISFQDAWFSPALYREPGHFTVLASDRQGTQNLMQSPHPFWITSRETKNHVSAFVHPVRHNQTPSKVWSKALRYGNRGVSATASQEVKWTQAHSLALKESDTAHHVHPLKLFVPQSTMASSILLETVPTLCYHINHVQELMVGIS